MSTAHKLEPQTLPFDCEHALHLYLLNNLESLEPGLTLYGKENLDGLQFKCLGKKLDLLAEDREGGLVAIEIKFNYGTPESLGQILGYLAVIRRLRRFAGRRLRGLLVCRKASEHLLLAAEDNGSVAVYEYTPGLRFLHALEALSPIHIPE